MLIACLGVWRKGGKKEAWNGATHNNACAGGFVCDVRWACRMFVALKRSNQRRCVLFVLGFIARALSVVGDTQLQGLLAVSTNCLDGQFDVSGLGPRKAMTALCKAVTSDEDLLAWLQSARVCAIVGSCPKSLKSAKSWICACFGFIAFSCGERVMRSHLQLMTCWPGLAFFGIQGLSIITWAT